MRRPRRARRRYPRKIPLKAPPEAKTTLFGFILHKKSIKNSSTKNVPGTSTPDSRTVTAIVAGAILPDGVAANSELITKREMRKLSPEEKVLDPPVMLFVC